ncbi:hypothetical protein CFC21_085155 [Triticum aestivum]|uniref:Auxin-responsive protein n=4 Tax=Triticum TaxID=4564 RepID=A0A9R0Y904_TRITD|nr:auxin-responsive protein IAA9-like [Triticum dicoccoides]KAF7081182.1 hypothetical protein CFC21_085155 [Triticum aestivum]VAI51051.1 unnamed protein product [Triticum turgidum subsp. durum]
MELELGLAPPTNAGRPPLGSGKRGFGEAFGEDEEQRRTSTTTLPLFDDGSSSSSCDSGSGGGVGGSKKALVGWPPVSSARSRACGRHVKVWKEGAAIGRKVYLPFHGSYADLLATLARMFPDPAGDRAGCLGGAAGKGEGEMVVTYEDADGDWMLVGDVPWEDFARSVKRLKILL